MNPKLYVGTIGMSVWFSEDLGETWERPNSEHGLHNESRVWALCCHPDVPGEMYAGTDQGLHRWDEAERHWHHLPSPLDTLHIWALAQHPADPDLMFAGVSPGALYRSRDRGRSWTRLDVDMPVRCMFNVISRVTQVVIDPIDPDIVWASVEIDAIHRSRDGGDSWQRLDAGLVSDDVHGLEVVRHGGGRRVLLPTNRGIFVSDDDGASFRQVVTGSPREYFRSIVARADHGGVLFASNGDGPPGSWGRLYRSEDNGDSWQEVTLPACTNSTLWKFAVHDFDPDLIFALSNLGQIFRSRDGGGSWSKLDREFGEVRSAMWRPI